MTEWQGKRYWLIGASEGLGVALAAQLSRAGVHVILSARNEDRLKQVAASLPGPATVQAMDVSDMESVTRAAEAAGDVDGVVYLAGAYWPMAAADWQAEKAETMADVNFTGLVRTMGAVVPAMAACGRGHIVITGSIAGFRGLPGAIGYAASKAGVIRLAECMHADLRKSGVRVQLANPGFIRTRLTDKNDFRMPFLMEPEEAAREIFELMNSTRFQKSFPWRLSWMFGLGRLLPDGLYYRLFS